MKKRLRAGLDTGSAALPGEGSPLSAAPGSLQPTRAARGSSRRPSRQISVSIHAAATTALLALSLAACQSAPVKDRIVEVKIPIPTTPLKPAQVPAMPAPLPARPDNLSAAADILLAKVCEWVAYGLRAKPLLDVSAGQQPGEARHFPECER